MLLLDLVYTESACLPTHLHRVCILARLAHRLNQAVVCDDGYLLITTLLYPKSA